MTSVPPLPPNAAPQWAPPGTPPRVVWYRRKGAVISGAMLGALIVIGVIGSAVSPSSTRGSTNSSTTQTVTIAAANTAPAVPTTSVPASTAAATQPAAPTTSPAQQTVGFAMPNEVGRVLQVAQDDLQRVSGNPLYVSFSDDLLGSRSQINDSNWQVCSQSLAAGQHVSDDDMIRFGVVKLGETCP